MIIPQVILNLQYPNERWKIQQRLYLRFYNPPFRSLIIAKENNRQRDHNFNNLHLIVLNETNKSKFIATMKVKATITSNLLFTAGFMILASFVNGENCQVSQHGFYGQQELSIPEIFDAIDFHYQIEYNENEFADDFDTMLHELEIKMVQRIVNHSSIFEECNTSSRNLEGNTDSTNTAEERPALSSRPKDIVSTKQCVDQPSASEKKCVVMEGQMTFFYPESRQTFFEGKLRDYNAEIRQILKNGMDAYTYSDYHSIPGIDKLKYLLKREYDELPLTKGDNEEGKGSDIEEGSFTEPKANGGGSRTSLIVLLLSTTAATLFGMYLIRRKRRAETSANFQGGGRNNTNMV